MIYIKAFIKNYGCVVLRVLALILFGTVSYFAYQNIKNQIGVDVILIEEKNTKDAFESVSKIILDDKLYPVNKKKAIELAKLGIILNGYTGQGGEKCVNKFSDILTGDVEGIIINNMGLIGTYLFIANATNDYLKRISDKEQGSGSKAAHVAGRIYSDKAVIILNGVERKFAYVKDLGDCSKALEEIFD
ncbi:hypothetical protein [Vibrio parahaemolyticus]|uniref:hypothetical protein n=1 Tax=Vibrio parahaemolyticus TaxID=670 RepID=UPI0024BC9DB8|nr:hypothetical protein [Vibrio parahaemolyticus]WHT06129.1 hypothetical protein O2T11_24750 [Vibrio parahaemolyticus]